MDDIESGVENPGRGDTELWTITRAAAYCGCGVITFRGYQRSQGAPRTISRQPGAGGEGLVEAEAVRAWQASRPGRGARTDQGLPEARALAERVLGDYYPRRIDETTYRTEDGLEVLVGWHRNRHTPLAEQFRLGRDHYFRVGRHGNWDISPDDVETLAASLARALRAARKDVEAHAAQDARDTAGRAEMLRRLTAAADEVEAAKAEPGRPRLMDAFATRKHLVALARERYHHGRFQGDNGFRFALSLEEIAQAARMPVDDVEHAS
ncbi:hypothetical protein [Actinokineospora sp. NBRC 105648]|uniref:hypothetical protein n=1 Tax=Actinokineospora sp. NBRC 105648 TaxID=3032206 RepID=UPI0024A12A9E|nr:hypothetical protein [Actinokineospora sp. NBRC 105648]GLZ43533.1 hypothetical protein Acsp05_71570 [Actinokineospora sp. NBRC 105648]